MKKNKLLALFAAIIVITTSVSDLRADEIPPLEKSDARKIIKTMGYKNVAIGAIIQRIGYEGELPFYSSSVALVVAYAESNGQPVKFRETFFYDRDLGWLYYEIDTKMKRVRLWTSQGYTQVTPEKEEQP